MHESDRTPNDLLNKLNLKLAFLRDEAEWKPMLCIVRDLLVKAYLHHKFLSCRQDDLIDRVMPRARWDEQGNLIWCEQCGEEPATHFGEHAVLCSSCQEPAEDLEGEQNDGELSNEEEALREMSDAFCGGFWHLFRGGPGAKEEVAAAYAHYMEAVMEEGRIMSEFIHEIFGLEEEQPVELTLVVTSRYNDTVHALILDEDEEDVGRLSLPEGRFEQVYKQLASPGIAVRVIERGSEVFSGGGDD